jgi:hypothetical protein
MTVTPDARFIDAASYPSADIVNADAQTINVQRVHGRNDGFTVVHPF